MGSMHEHNACGRGCLIGDLPHCVGRFVWPGQHTGAMAAYDRNGYPLPRHPAHEIIREPGKHWPVPDAAAPGGELTHPHQIYQSNRGTTKEQWPTFTPTSASTSRPIASINPSPLRGRRPASEKHSSFRRMLGTVGPHKKLGQDTTECTSKEATRLRRLLRL